MRVRLRASPRSAANEGKAEGIPAFGRKMRIRLRASPHPAANEDKAEGIPAFGRK
jgi:hypothetical protein